MIQPNSPALQTMINSVRPGTGNMTTAPVYTPVQFQSPYPSPLDMVQQQQYGGYPPPQYPMGPAPGTITRFEMGGVPVELEYRPEYPTPTQQGTPNPTGMGYPGAPVGANPSQTPPQGRVFNVQQSVPGYAEHLRARQQALSPANPIVGARATFSQEGSKLVIRPKKSGIVGRVDYYEGEPVHPHMQPGWYGSASHPFYKTVTTDPLEYGPQQQQYVNPWFQQQQVNRTKVTAEQQDLANLAAYYGFSYDDWIHNGAAVYQNISRACSRYYGISHNEAEVRANKWRVKYPGEEQDDSALFYPPGSFGPDGQLTRDYLQTFCVDHERLETMKRSIKIEIVAVNAKGEIVSRTPTKPRNIPINERIRKRTMIDSIERTEAFNEQVKWRRRQVFLQMYQQAPERMLDSLSGNVFQVLGETLTRVYQHDLIERCRYQNATRATMTYNHAANNSQIMDFYRRAKASREAKRRKEWSDLINKVVPDSELPRIREEAMKLYTEGKPYIEDGDWVIAKPGYDIVGLPLDVSVNKIIRMNCVTGEEEIYNPDRPVGQLVREQIEQAVRNPNFTEIDSTIDERLKDFKNTHWES